MRVNYDLHIHSCLSPCGDEDMTPNNIVNMAKLMGLDVIAISDHNTTGNAAAFLKVAESVGITAFAGMELETAEEIHVLCLFYELESAEAFDSEVVRPALPNLQNRTDLFGNQYIMDEKDRIVGEEQRYLINATAISIDDLPTLVKKYGGIAIPAHIDKSSKSIISVFGYVDRSMGFTAFELSKNAPEDFAKAHPQISDCFFLYDTDSHYLGDVGESGGKNYFELKDAKKETVWRFLLGKSTNL